MTPARWRLAASLFTVYILWATSYLAVKQAVADIPPLLLSGARSVLAGIVLYAFVRWRREPQPSAAEWRGAGLVGLLTIPCGSSLLALGLREASSGTAAVLFAAMPIFVGLILAAGGTRISRWQWFGSVLGLSGVGLLNLDSFSASVGRGNLLVLAGAACTALAAVCIARGRMPASLLWSSCVQLLVGGVAAVVLGFIVGERVAEPGLQAVIALAYLSFVISVFGYVAYNYLTRHAGPTLATSYAYVNPPVAVAIGAIFLGEAVTGRELLAIGVVLTGVAIVIVASTGATRRAVAIEAGPR